MAQIFLWFCDFGRGRGSGFSGPAEMDWLRLQAWARQRDIELDDFETDCLLDLDAIYLSVWHQKHAPKEAKP